nr:lytic transglycosylase domain-containing protein [Clostridiales bacterium]
DLILKKTHPLPYNETVKKYSAVYAVPEEIIYAVINTESEFKSDAVSKKGAIGLMQIMPETFEWLCSKNSEEDASAELLYNPEVNIKYGTYYLSLLYSEYGVWETVYAAYNAGRSTVNAWLSDTRYNNNGKLVNIPYPETAKYTEKVSKSAAIYKKLYFSGEKSEDEDEDPGINSVAYGTVVSSD